MELAAERNIRGDSVVHVTDIFSEHQNSLNEKLAESAYHKKKWIQLTPYLTLTINY